MHGNLGFNIWSDQSLRSAIVLDICGPNNSENVVAVAYSRTFGLENEASGTLRWDISSVRVRKELYDDMM